MIEMWREIENYENIYQVSNLGKIRSLDREITYKYKENDIRSAKLKGRNIKISKDNNGYAITCLTKNTKGKTHKIHRLVAKAFISNPEKKKCVNHKNGIKNDNRVENLEWCTHSENSIHSYKIGTSTSKHKYKKIIISKDGKNIKFKSIKEASLYIQCKPNSLWAVLSGKHIKIYGWRAKYIK